jgi:UDP-glucuronate 4-epimerase
MKTYLVTGGAGFIGSHLVDKLLSNGNKVHIIDNFDTFYEKKIKLKNLESSLLNNKCILHEIDIKERNNLRNVFYSVDGKIECVIHLAAKAGVRPSIDDPLGYYETNVMGTLNILETMKEIGCKRMIFASSSSVYGNNQKTPFSEDDNVDNPISPYAATKKAGELLCHTYHHLYDFDIFCLRFFTVYGPRQRPDLAIYKFAKLIIEEKPIPFYGDGSTERDYTYIDDIIDGILAAINNLKGYDIFNLGASRTITLYSIVEMLENTLGKKAILKKLPLQPGDVIKTFADISKAKQKLGYNPKISFEAGLKNFIEWFLNSY